MSLVKKVVFLIVLFIGFIIYSVYSFDFDSQSNTQTLVTTTTKTEINSTDTGLIDKIINFFASSDSKDSKPFNLVLTKKDGIVTMDGIFSNASDAKKVADILNINRDGEYTYEDDVVIDEVLLSKVAVLITPFKDFFADNSKLTVLNNEVILSGELKDANYKDLLDSILSGIKIDLKTNIIVPEIGTLDVINKSLEKNSSIIDEKSLETKVLELQDKKKITNEPIKSDTSSKLSEVQLSINEILATKKINFERRSSVIIADSLIVVEEIAKILNDNPTFKIEVAGHTDSKGKESLNKQISQDRASSVADVLISLGINKDRVSAVGYGEEFPIAKDDENGLSEINRRVEFNILGE